MFNWKKNFKSIILDRGYRYFVSKRVADVCINTDLNDYETCVSGQGGKIYEVSVPIDLIDDENDYMLSEYMYCDCAYAADGNMCKHMAAMLYKMEAQGIINHDDDCTYQASMTSSTSAKKMNSQGIDAYKAALENGIIKRGVSGTTQDGGRTDSTEKSYNPFRENGNKVNLETEINPESECGASATALKLLKGYMQPYKLINLAHATRDLHFTESTYEKAKKLIDANALFNFEVKRYTNVASSYRHAYRISASMDERTYYNWYQNTIIDINKDEIIYVYCDSSKCRIHNQTSRQARLSNNRDSLCEHAVALLLLFDEYMKENSSELDMTSDTGRHLLNSFSHISVDSDRQNKIEDGDGKTLVTKNISLEPVLLTDESKVFVEFKIGANRMYKLKSISELIEHVDKKDEMKLGKNNVLDFMVQDFDEQSAELYEYIRAIYDEDKEKERFMIQNSRDYNYYSGYHTSELLKNGIPLYGSKLDDFYEMYKGRSVEYVNAEYYRNNTSEVYLEDNDVKITVYGKKIIDEDKQFQGIRLETKPIKFYNGNKSSYYLDEGHFYRVSKENMKAISAFSYSPYSDGIVIGRNNLADFYYDVLPQVDAYVDYIEDDSALIQEYLPPKPDFIFYLDSSQKEVYCKTVVRYDEDEYTIEIEPDNSLRISGYRNRKYEYEIVNMISEYFTTYYANIQSFGCENDPDLIYNLLANGIKKFMMYGEVRTTPAFDNLKLKKKWKFSVGVAVKNDLMNLSILSDDISVEELGDILNSYKKKKKYHRLKNGDFLSMDDASLLGLSEMLDALQLSPKDFIKKNGNVKVPLFRALYLDKMLEEHEEISSDRDRNFKNLVRSFKTTKDADYELPESLDNVMRKYQKHGFRWLMTMDNYGFGGILADEMGLGKTLQVISMLYTRKCMRNSCAAEEDKSEKSPATSLVVCPSSLVYNWAEEFAKFAPDMKVKCVVGNKSEREMILRETTADSEADVESFGANMNQMYDVLITSYDLLKRDIDLYADASFDYEIVDEAQYIKNHNTAATKSVKVINSMHRIALTGTPIENRLSELWSIFDYLMPGYLYSYEKFRKEFETVIVSKSDEEASEQLRRMVSPFIMRRLKKDVLKDLPEKIEETRIAVFESEQQKLYDAQVLKLKNMLEDTSESEMKKQKIQVLAELTRLRQICCDPSLIFENYKAGSAKLQALIDLLSNAIEGGHRCLVFSQFTSMFDIIEQVLRKEGIEFYKITGSTSKEERAKLVKAFNNGTTPVFLISLKAGGTGLNLTGADTVVHYDPWWNVAVQNQATDRAHRIGQERIVTVYKLIAKGTIEEKIVKLQETKKELAEEILSGETGNLASMTRDELMELIA